MNQHQSDIYYGVISDPGEYDGDKYEQPRGTVLMDIAEFKELYARGEAAKGERETLTKKIAEIRKKLNNNHSGWLHNDEVSEFLDYLEKEDKPTTWDEGEVTPC